MLTEMKVFKLADYVIAEDTKVCHINSLKWQSISTNDKLSIPFGWIYISDLPQLHMKDVFYNSPIQIKSKQKENLTLHTVSYYLL